MKLNQGVAVGIGAVWLLALTAVTGYEIERASHHLHGSQINSHYHQQLGR